MRLRSGVGMLVGLILMACMVFAIPALAGGGGYDALSMDAVSVSVDTVPVYTLDANVPGVIASEYVTSIAVIFNVGAEQPNPAEHVFAGYGYAAERSFTAYDEIYTATSWRVHDEVGWCGCAAHS